MKLRNKKTGEVRDWDHVGCWDEGAASATEIWEAHQYKSIAELTDEWEDVRESTQDVQEIFDGWKESGIKSKLTGLTIAPENVTKELAGDIGTEHEGKMFFTWDEAMELEEKVLKPNGWRLPTRSEWVLLAEEFGQDENGELDGDVFREKLNLPLTGDFWNGTYYHGTTHGFYWSRVPYSATNAYNLYFTTSGGLSPQDDDYKQDGFAVRAVKEKE